MLVSGLSSICQAADVDPLSATEKREGTMAFSALLYEYGAQLSAASLVVMWCVAVLVPRVMKFVEKQRAEQRKNDPAALPAMIAEAKAA